MNQLRQQVHPSCRCCGEENNDGLQLNFTVHDGDKVEAIFKCDDHYRGYDNILHGGVISSLADSAMTNCLFAYGKIAVTAELKVRYKKAVVIGKQVLVRAWLHEPWSKLYRMRAEIWQSHELKVAATGLFIDHPNLMKVGGKG